MTPAADRFVGEVRTWPGPPRPDATLGRMADIIRAEYQSARVVSVADEIMENVNGKDTAAMARAILVWLREHTNFVPDPVGQQRLTVPVLLLIEIAADGKTTGDCVDIAMLAACLLMAVGINARLVAESYAIPCNPLTSPLVHVYTIAQTDDGWLALDTQQPADGTPLVPCRRMVLTLP